MPPWVRIAVGILVAVHGYVYIPFAVYLVHEFQRTYGTGRLLRSVLAPAALRTATLTLHVVTGASLLAAGALLVFAPGAALAWRTLAVAGGGLGVIAFVLAWNGRPNHLSEQGILGAAASLAVFVAGLALAQHLV